MTQPRGNLGSSLKIWYSLVLGLVDATGAVTGAGGGITKPPGLMATRGEIAGWIGGIENGVMTGFYYFYLLFFFFFFSRDRSEDDESEL